MLRPIKLLTIFIAIADRLYPEVSEHQSKATLNAPPDC